jgi:Family of unknown function (DUF6130)
MRNALIALIGATVFGLPAGPHKVRIELVNANHQTLDQAVVNFVIP